MSLGDEAPAAQTGRTVTGDLRALAHPIRLRILSLLTGAEMNAAEVARELGITHANASYHLRLLLNAATIEVAGQEKIRGGQAKRYRYDVDKAFAPRGDRAHPQPEDVQIVYAALAAELQRRARAIVTGPDSVGTLTDAELWIDLDEWRKIRDRVAQASEHLHRLAQRPHSPGTVRVSASIALFRMHDDAPTPHPQEQA
ncbi:helix-turn-helix domain-containing protein [Catellatospora sichuanensis]|uniref:helix-turn-helix domain-containing protein n=1 Tax=Catellatospora sichuanensis TaxID=1969805 RepID=UPI001182A893|nr:helix-turn-helix domain-containing protein [Catellatospora sichuanensis]